MRQECRKTTRTPAAGLKLAGTGFAGVRTWWYVKDF